MSLALGDSPSKTNNIICNQGSFEKALHSVKNESLNKSRK